MKACREHQVPLSNRSIEVLRQAEEPAEVSSDLVFPGLRGKPLSDMVFTAMLRRLDIPAVAHGFRSSFKKGAPVILGTRQSLRGRDKQESLGKQFDRYPLGGIGSSVAS